VNHIFILLSATLFSSNVFAQESKVWNFVEQRAEFPGGNEALLKWLAQNIKPDTTLMKDLVVKAIFTINEKGLPVLIIAQGDTSNGKGREVIKLIESMPAWKPGRQGGRPVKMRMALPSTGGAPEEAHVHLH